jgi:hypothetical protein
MHSRRSLLLVSPLLLACACSLIRDELKPPPDPPPQSPAQPPAQAKPDPAPASPPDPAPKTATADEGGAVWLPDGDVFTPPIAGPREVRSQVAYERLHADQLGTFNLASVAFGDGIGIVRWPCGGDDAVQLGLSGAVFAQFNMDTPSHDLINADYVIGVPLSARFSDWSGRLRLYHQSSHLGDEFILDENQQPINRINLSYEALELIAAYQWRWFEFYGGPSRIIHTETPLAKNRVEAGVNYFSDPIGLGSARLVGGFDYGSWQETDWDADLSAKFGIEFNPNGGRRILRILIDWYHGHLPFGQFYPLEGDYYGIGFTLNF